MPAIPTLGWRRRSGTSSTGILPAGLALLAAYSSAFAGSTLERVESKGELTGVLMENYPPFSFLNEQNQLDGFDVDVAKAVAKRLGVKLKLETPCLLHDAKQGAGRGIRSRLTASRSHPTTTKLWRFRIWR